MNALDRGTVGNHSHAASIAADATVYATMVAPVLADLLDVGASRAFAEDLIVFVETLEVASGVQNAVNLAVSRPRPLTYAGDPKFVTSGEGYLSFYAGRRGDGLLGPVGGLSPSGGATASASGPGS